MDELTASLNYSKLKFIDYFGTDKQGQHIFAIYACRLPERQELNGHIFIELVEPFFLYRNTEIGLHFLFLCNILIHFTAKTTTNKYLEKEYERKEKVVNSKITLQTLTIKVNAELKLCYIFYSNLIY